MGAGVPAMGRGGGVTLYGGKGAGEREGRMCHIKRQNTDCAMGHLVLPKYKDNSAIIKLF